MAALVAGTLPLPDMRRSLTSLQRKGLVWALAVLFLLGGAMPMLSRMRCLQSGRTVVSVGLAKDCCPDDARGTNATVKAVCCEVMVAKPSHQPFTPHQGHPLAPALAVEEAISAPPPAALRHPVPATCAKRPPPGPKQRLATLRCILV